MKLHGGYEGAITSGSLDGLQQGDIVVVGGVNKLAEDQNVRLEAGTYNEKQLGRPSIKHISK